VLAGDEYVPAAHHGQSVLRPSVLDAEPTRHGSQSSSWLVEHAAHPMNILCLPAPHCRHALIPTNEYTPAGHRLQLTLRATGLKLPGSHCGQFAGRPSADEYLPGWQSWQVELVTAPDDVENVPGWQSVQASDTPIPRPVWNVPAAHSRQFPTAGDAKPVEYVPAWQSRQGWDTELLGSTAGLYLPAVHALQFTPSQPAGGSIWPVILGSVAFQPPTPV
jgi:hypothetical protein